MKILRIIAALLAFTSASHADDPESEVAKSSGPPGGEQFVSLIEHILVPADQLDTWMKKNPLSEDASSLRKQARVWIKEKTARLDHTALSTGIAGREFSNSSIWEQIYATEYIPPKPGEWPIPTAFQSRNLGYSQNGGAEVEDGKMILRSKMDWYEMILPQQAWDPLTERTRQPDDVFLPRFRGSRYARPVVDAAGNPLSSEKKFPIGADQLRFAPGKTYLVSREANDHTEPPPGEPHHLVRLIFFQGNILRRTEPSEDDSVAINHLSIKIIRLPHSVFSAWIQENDLFRIPDLAWAAAMGWQNQGTTETIGSLTTATHSGSKGIAGAVDEVSYPTEWEPGRLTPATGGKPAQLEFSEPTAFDTRNVGTSTEVEILPDAGGAIVQFEIKRVTESGKSVHQRIFRDGQWKTDMTMPIFATNHWSSQLRVKRGEWLLVGSGAATDGKGRLDPQHSVLAFIKLD
ncbi:hypothetical protein JIN84_03820 [Luteolibacter yonseiensis]|uniref:Uncharacterized protein n=1 Tax=Luteolibacter yonseiensis TaxID=1144680 RepID=A0A934R1R7_9BACT|nr:hypothetical protein [Luteolibacter yonseiensis]MBK1814726.1 hypothetical protein [Luteolibacter yonseiensis]